MIQMYLLYWNYDNNYPVNFKRVLNITHGVKGVGCNERKIGILWKLNFLDWNVVSGSYLFCLSGMCVIWRKKCWQSLAFCHEFTALSCFILMCQVRVIKKKVVFSKWYRSGKLFPSPASGRTPCILFGLIRTYPGIFFFVSNKSKWSNVLLEFNA